MEAETREFVCKGCDELVVTEPACDTSGQLCEDCELVALAILDGDDEHRERLAVLFERLELRAAVALCDDCGTPLAASGLSRDAVLLSWHNFEIALCNECAEERLRAEQASAGGA